jgi:hypothetical protein
MDIKTSLHTPFAIFGWKAGPPATAEDWHKKGNSLSVHRDFAGALIAYEKALKLKPDYYSAWIERSALASNG